MKTHKNDHNPFMQRAIELSFEGMRGGFGGPFGAVIVKGGKIIGEGFNQVLRTNDPTAHAEVQAIRKASQFLNDFNLQGCELFTSCEPCPMCLGAIYWARLDQVYFACTRVDAAWGGFDDAFFYEQIPLTPEQRSLPMSQVLRDPAFKAFEEWKQNFNKIMY